LSEKQDTEHQNVTDCGKLQIYTGNGKGKTTAALGLTLRAVGAGFTVFIGQFLKGRHCSELDGIKKLGETVTVERFGSGTWAKKGSSEDSTLAQNGLECCVNALASGKYNIIILDEIFGTLNAELLRLQDLLGFIRKWQQLPDKPEIIMTGRNAPPEIIEIADLVTEMRAIKHYYKDGLGARTGIEN